MKKIFSFIALVAIIGNLSAQTTEAEETLKKVTTDSLDGWKIGGVAALNLTQVNLTNWSAGGENSLSVNGLLSLFANLKRGNSTWDNSLDLAYGMLQQGNNSAIRKTDDKIDFTSKYGQKAFKNWYYAGLINFKSQMTPGYNYPNDTTKISNFLAPGYLLGAIGMDYKPSEVFTLFISPLTMKMTIVNDQTLADAGAFGVEAATYDATTGNLTKHGLTTRTEYGGYLRALFKKDIMKNINLQSKLELFSNYEAYDYVDVNWEVLIAMKVNKYISATLSTQLLYDHDINIAIDNNNDGIIDENGPRVQFKEVLGVGFSYKF